MGGVRTAIAIAAAGDFAVSNTTCDSSLEPLSTCNISVVFKPRASGTRTGTLTVADHADNSPQKTSLSGTGTVVLALSTSKLSFAYQLVGTTSPVKNLTLTNKAAVRVPVSLAANDNFAVSSSTCGSSVAPLASCEISVRFKPTASGIRTGTLMVKDSAHNSPQTASLSGIGTWIIASPASVAFGNQRLGTTAPARTVTFMNKGGSLIFISNISASGDFAASATTCGATLGAGSACTVSVTFTPGHVSPLSGILTIDATASVPTVALSGTGISTPKPISSP
jgi:hypothetical protein